MTALAGCWRFDGGPAADHCSRILAGQRAIGGDRPELWRSAPVALGQGSLSRAAQRPRPVVGAGGQRCLVADLRLDNRAELGRQLNLSIAECDALPDNALLMLALDAWGLDALDRVLGPFAFALWDGGSGRLVLARDPMSERPLFWHRAERFFAFASMPSGLHALPDVPYAVDETRLADILALAPELGPRSVFAEVNRVEPGCILTVDQRGEDSRRWWRPPRPAGRPPSFADAVAMVRDEFNQAVARCLRDAGPVVASHLSAGLDSGGVCVTAARRLAEDGRRVVAYTAVPPQDYDSAVWAGRLVDEGPEAAAIAAAHPNIEHVLIRPPQRDPLPLMERAARIYQRPLTNPCNEPWYAAIHDDIRQRGIRVLLAGYLGNLTFSYDGAPALTEMLLAGQPLAWLDLALDIRRQGGRPLRQTLLPLCPAWLYRLAHDIRHGTGTGFAGYSALASDWHATVVARGRAAGFDPDFLPPRDGYAARVDTLSLFDTGTVTKGILGHWGIEVRDPTADRRLVETCLTLPTAYFTWRGQPRAIARAVLADRLPDATLRRRVRALQTVAWHGHWSANQAAVAEELGRIENTPAARGLLNLDQMRRIQSAWPVAAPESRWTDPVTIRDYRAVFLRGLAVGHFARMIGGGNS